MIKTWKIIENIPEDTIAKYKVLKFIQLLSSVCLPFMFIPHYYVCRCHIVMGELFLRSI